MASFDEFKSRIRISEIVGKSIALKRAGRDEHVGLCPFHPDRDPSLTVTDAKGFAHCFSCNWHGDVIDFVQQHDGLDFRQAVDKIAAIAGIDPPAQSDRQASRDPLYRANEAASAWFVSMLDGRARSYLDGRGVGQDLIERFMIGHAPNSRLALIDHLLGQGFDRKTIEAAGLAFVTDDGALVSRFVNRITFPVLNRAGRLCGFTARTLGEAKAKYINSPATPIFDKGRLLYGSAHVDRKDRTATVVLVEGAMDVIAIARSGLNIAVAPLGTAVTAYQLLDLWAMSDVPTVCLDGDEAGLRAGRRLVGSAMEILRPGKSLGFVRLPVGKDPDDIVTEGGPAAMARQLARPIPMMDFLWRFESRGMDPGSGPHEKAALHQRIREAIETVPDITVRQALFADLRSRWNGLVRDKQSPGSDFLRMPTNMTEAGLLGFLLACPDALDLVEDDLEAMAFDDSSLESCRAVMARWSMEGLGSSVGLEEYLIASGSGAAVSSIMNSVPYRNVMREGLAPEKTADAWRKACEPYFDAVEKKMAKDALRRAIESGDEDEIMRRMEIYNRGQNGERA